MPTIRKRADDELIVNVPIGDPALKRCVKVRFLSRTDLAKIRKQSTVRTLNPKTHQFEDAPNDELFARTFLSKALVGFSGVSWRTLAGWCEACVEFVGDDLDQLIPEGSAEAHEVFVDHGKNSVILPIIQSSTDDFEEALKIERESELKN